jgi:hypothetical protein
MPVFLVVSVWAEGLVVFFELVDVDEVVDVVFQGADFGDELEFVCLFFAGE